MLRYKSVIVEKAIMWRGCV